MIDFLNERRIAIQMIDEYYDSFKSGFYYKLSYNDASNLAALYVNEKTGSNSTSTDNSTRVLIDGIINCTAIQSNLDEQWDSSIISAFFALQAELETEFSREKSANLVIKEFSKLPMLNLSYSDLLPSLGLAMLGIVGVYFTISAPIKVFANPLLSPSAGLCQVLCFGIGAFSLLGCIAGFSLVSQRNSDLEIKTILNNKILEVLDTSFAKTELAKKLENKELVV